MSWEFIIIGVSQLPNPPIIMGITMKKIMMMACDVTIVLNVWSEGNSLLG